MNLGDRGLAAKLGIAPRGAIPLWLKIGYTAWFLVWVPMYAANAGPANFLWLCDVANFLILIALWTEHRLLFSAQAVGVVVIQLSWIVDVAARITLGFHPIGGTEYMFDPTEPVVVRVLSLFHLWVPILLLWAVRRLGFDARAWKLQSLICGMILPLSFLADPELNLNWLWRPFGVEQTLLPPWLYLLACVALYPLLLFIPSQLLIGAWARRAPASTPRTS